MGDPLTFEPHVAESLRQLVIAVRVVVILLALLYVDRVWEVSRRILKNGLLGSLFLSTVPCFGQSTTVTVDGVEVYAQIDGQLVYPLLARSARYTQNGSYTGAAVNSTAIAEMRVGAVYIISQWTSSSEWFLEWKIDLPPAKYKVYAQAGRATPSGYGPPRQFAVSASPIVDNEFRSPQVIFNSPSNSGQLSGATVVTNVAGTEYSVPCKEIGEVTIWGGSRYIAARMWDEPVGATMVQALYFKKVADVPTWLRYIGGDVDTTGYFDGIKASDGIGVVVLPLEQLMIPGSDAVNGLGGATSDIYFQGTSWEREFQEKTTQSGVTSRYVQLTFLDHRYGSSDFRSDVGLPTFGWVISLGRNGGLTARSWVWKGSGNSWITVAVSDWYQYGPSGQWRCDLQRRDTMRMPRMTAYGSWEGTGFFEDSPSLSRFPYEAPEFWASPVAMSNTASGVAGGPPSAVVTVGKPTSLALSSDAGTHAARYQVLPWAAAFGPNSHVPMVQSRNLVYPLHINHLRAVVQCARSLPPLNVSEQRFVDLLDQWVQACDGATTFTEYRAQVARGASDTVVVEEEGDGADAAPDQEGIRTTLPPSPPSGSVPDFSNPFAGVFPSDKQGMEFVLDLNDAIEAWTGTENSGLRIEVNTDPAVMKEKHPEWEGWYLAFDSLNTFRVFLRAFLLICLNVWFYWGQISTVWREM